MSDLDPGGERLSPGKVRVLRLMVAAACRKLADEDVLDLADHLHDLIRRRRRIRSMTERPRIERPAHLEPPAFGPPPDVSDALLEGEEGPGRADGDAVEKVRRLAEIGDVWRE